jgi:hypothetical protein
MALPVSVPAQLVEEFYRHLGYTVSSDGNFTEYASGGIHARLLHNGEFLVAVARVEKLLTDSGHSIGDLEKFAEDNYSGSDFSAIFRR